MSKPTSHGKSRNSPRLQPNVKPATLAGSRADIVFPLAIFLFALALRVIYLSQVESLPLFYQLAGDGRSYDEWAQRIAGGDWVGGGVFYQAPLYPYFLAVLQSILGRDLWLIRVVQIVLGSVSCALVYQVGKLFFSREAGMAAGIILAVYAPAIFSDGLIQKTVLDLFFVTLLLLILANAQQKHHVSQWMTAGAVLGLLGLTRENALIWVFVVPVWVWFYFTDERRSVKLKWSAYFLAGTLLVLMPVGLRNLMVGGELTLTTAQLGPNFYIGNNPEANGTYVPLRGGHGDPRVEQRDAVELAELELGRRLSPAEVSFYWLWRSMEYISRQPLDWLRLTGRKWLMLLNARELVDTDDFYLYQEWSGLLKVLAWVGHFGFLAPLAVLGMFLTLKQWQRLSLLYVLLGTLAFSVTLFFVVGRYRLPMIPFLALFAGTGLVDGLRLSREGVPRQWLTGVAVLALSVVLVYRPVIDQPGPSAAGYNNLANALEKQGRFEEAIKHYQKAIDLNPHDAQAYYNLGNVFTRQNRLDAAKEQYETAIRLDPDFPEPYNNLGNVLSSRGELEEAIKQYRRAIALSPNRAEFHVNLGIALSKDERLDQAREHFQEAVSVEPRSAVAHYYLGMITAAQGDLMSAIEKFREALNIQPNFADARISLAQALAEQGKKEEAVREYETAERLLRSRQRDSTAR